MQKKMFIHLGTIVACVGVVLYMAQNCGRMEDDHRFPAEVKAAPNSSSVPTSGGGFYLSSNPNGELIKTEDEYFLADLDGDGKVDRIQVSGGDYVVTLMNGTLDRGLSTRIPFGDLYFKEAYIFTSFAADIDKDGIEDLVIKRNVIQNGTPMKVLDAYSVDRTALPTSLMMVLKTRIVQDSNEGSYTNLFADIDGDGKPDMFKLENDGSLSVRMAQTIGADRTFSPSRTLLQAADFPPTTFARDYAFGRVNADARLDLVYSSPIENNLIYSTAFSKSTATSNGTYTGFDPGLKIPVADNVPCGHFLADYDGDGRDDLIYMTRNYSIATQDAMKINIKKSIGSGFAPETLSYNVTLPPGQLYYSENDNAVRRSLVYPSTSQYYNGTAALTTLPGGAKAIAAAVDNSTSILCKLAENAVCERVPSPKSIPYDPGPPQQAKVQVLNSTSVRISWQPPAYHPSAKPLEYEYTIDELHGNTPYVTSGSSAVIENLKPDTNYTFAVCAVMRGQYSASSDLRSTYITITGKTAPAPIIAAANSTSGGTSSTTTTSSSSPSAAPSSPSIAGSQSLQQTIAGELQLGSLTSPAALAEYQEKLTNSLAVMSQVKAFPDNYPNTSSPIDESCPTIKAQDLLTLDDTRAVPILLKTMLSNRNTTTNFYYGLPIDTLANSATINSDVVTLLSKVLFINGRDIKPVSLGGNLAINALPPEGATPQQLYLVGTAAHDSLGMVVFQRRNHGKIETGLFTVHQNYEYPSTAADTENRRIGYLFWVDTEASTIKETWQGIDVGISLAGRYALIPTTTRGQQTRPISSIARIAESSNDARGLTLEGGSSASTAMIATSIKCRNSTNVDTYPIKLPKMAIEYSKKESPSDPFRMRIYVGGFVYGAAYFNNEVVGISESLDWYKLPPAPPGNYASFLNLRFSTGKDLILNDVVKAASFTDLVGTNFTFSVASPTIFGYQADARLTGILATDQVIVTPLTAMDCFTTSSCYGYQRPKPNNAVTYSLNNFGRNGDYPVAPPPISLENANLNRIASVEKGAFDPTLIDTERYSPLRHAFPDVNLSFKELYTRGTSPSGVGGYSLQRDESSFGTGLHLSDFYTNHKKIFYLDAAAGATSFNVYETSGQKTGAINMVNTYATYDGVPYAVLESTAPWVADDRTGETAIGAKGTAGIGLADRSFANGTDGLFFHPATPGQILWSKADGTVHDYWMRIPVTTAIQGVYASIGPGGVIASDGIKVMTGPTPIAGKMPFFTAGGLLNLKVSGYEYDINSPDEKKDVVLLSDNATGTAAARLRFADPSRGIIEWKTGFGPNIWRKMPVLDGLYAYGNGNRARIEFSGGTWQFFIHEYEGAPFNRYTSTLTSYNNNTFYFEFPAAPWLKASWSAYVMTVTDSRNPAAPVINNWTRDITMAMLRGSDATQGGALHDSNDHVYFYPPYSQSKYPYALANYLDYGSTGQGFKKSFFKTSATGVPLDGGIAGIMLKLKTIIGSNAADTAFGSNRDHQMFLAPETAGNQVYHIGLWATGIPLIDPIDNRLTAIRWEFANGTTQLWKITDEVLPERRGNCPLGENASLPIAFYDNRCHYITAGPFCERGPWGLAPGSQFFGSNTNNIPNYSIGNDWEPAADVPTMCTQVYSLLKTKAQHYYVGLLDPNEVAISSVGATPLGRILNVEGCIYGSFRYNSGNDQHYNTTPTGLYYGSRDINGSAMYNANLFLDRSGSYRVCRMNYRAPLALAPPALPSADQMMQPALGSVGIVAFVQTPQAVVSAVIPTITAIGPQTIKEDSSTGDLGFAVADPDTPVNALVVTAVSTEQNVVPDENIVLKGSGANRTVRVFHNHYPGQTTIELTVDDQMGHTVTSSFTVTVEPRKGDWYVIKDVGAPPVKQVYLTVLDQQGLDLRVIKAGLQASSGSFVDGTTLLAYDFGNVIRLNGNLATHEDGAVWTKLPNIAGTYLNRTNLAIGITQNGIDLQYLPAGTTTPSIGKFTKDANSIVNGTNAGTIAANGTINFASGAEWRKLPDLSGEYLDSIGNRFRRVSQDGVNVSLRFGSEAAKYIDQNTIETTSLGRGTISANSVVWSSGVKWERLPALDGVWYDSNKAKFATIRQDYGVLTLTDTEGVVTTGSFTNSTSIATLAFGAATYDKVTGILSFANGKGSWGKASIDTRFWAVSKPTGLAPTYIDQGGIVLTFTNAGGTVTTGNFTNRSAVTIPGWSLSGTLGTDALNLSNNIPWLKIPNIAGGYLNQTGSRTSISQNGLDVMMKSSSGAVTAARFTTSNKSFTVGSVVVTIGANGDLSFSDSRLWTKLINASGEYLEGGRVVKVVHDNAADILSYGPIPASFSDPKTIVNSALGTGVIENDRIVWSAGGEWQRLPNLDGFWYSLKKRDFARIRQDYAVLTFTDADGSKTTGSFKTNTEIMTTDFGAVTFEKATKTLRFVNGDLWQRVDVESN